MAVKSKNKKVEEVAAPAAEVTGEFAEPRLKKMYAETILPQLKTEFGFKNKFQVPRLEKITLNVGLGEAIDNPKAIELVVEELRVITGQQPVVTRAKKSIATFKLRQGQKIGCMVTLRGQKMWEFLDRLIAIAIPRIRDFRGFSIKSFDGRGNYSLGLKKYNLSC